MKTKHAKRKKKTGSERVIFTLPRSLTAELEAYARLLREGNKSGFVADAVRSYIDHFRKRQHTQLLREAYARSASHGRRISHEWEPLDDETWARLDELKAKPAGDH
jgi:metal-responsive CopG/Arc/MetJ family transcriptional regulator